MKKVTGIGGVFFASNNPKKLNEWYEKHLGIPVSEWGAMFEWNGKDEEAEGYTVWSTFAQSDNHFAPSKKDFMINYRVADLVALVEELKKEGVEITDEISDTEYGKFVHILDPEGNAIELFEPPASQG